MYKSLHYLTRNLQFKIKVLTFAQASLPVFQTQCWWVRLWRGHAPRELLCLQAGSERGWQLQMESHPSSPFLRGGSSPRPHHSHGKGFSGKRACHCQQGRACWPGLGLKYHQEQAKVRVQEREKVCAALFWLNLAS